MLRIYFNREDVARTRIAAQPDPLWELALSVQMLRPQRGDALFGIWRRQARAALFSAGLGPMAGVLQSLLPNVGYFPDFLTPHQAAAGLDAGLEAVRSTAVTTLAREIGQVASARRLSAQARSLTAGDPRLLEHLTDTMRRCYEVLVTPYGRGIADAIDRDRERRLAAFASGGIGEMLGSLAPMLSWSDGELRVSTHRDQELHLGGRGLLLIPSYYCVGGPLTLFDPELRPVLIYPVQRGGEAIPGIGGSPRALENLIGLTRSAVLGTLYGREISTTELARRVGIAAGSASEHTKVLRESGLIVSRRDKNRMLHSLSALGRTVLIHNQ